MVYHEISTRPKLYLLGRRKNISPAFDTFYLCCNIYFWLQEVKAGPINGSLTWLWFISSQTRSTWKYYLIIKTSINWSWISVACYFILSISIKYIRCICSNKTIIFHVKKIRNIPIHYDKRLFCISKKIFISMETNMIDFYDLNEKLK